MMMFDDQEIILLTISKIIFFQIGRTITSTSIIETLFSPVLSPLLSSPLLIVLGEYVW